MGITNRQSEGPLTRRKFLTAGAALGVAAAAPAIIGSRAKAEQKVVYVNTYGGTIRAAETAAYYKPFTEKTGIEVRPVEGVSIAKLKAMVQSKNYEFDVTILDLVDVFQVRLEKLLEPVDATAFDAAAIAPGCLIEDGIYLRALGTDLSVRTDKFPQGAPKSWADFWDVQKFPGNRALLNQYYSAMAYALIADGVPTDKLYPMDIERAFKKLDAIKPHIRVWWTQGNQSEVLIRDGEVVMMDMWNGRAQTVIDQHSPVEIVWNGGMLSKIYYVVPLGTPRAKLAWQFIAFCNQAERQAAFSKLLPYGPANPKAFEHMTPEESAKCPSAPDHAKVAFIPDPEWLGPRAAQLRERFAQWVAS
jgi:putative spermidine/putrescine transport system substrate-binding protein